MQSPWRKSAGGFSSGIKAVQAARNATEGPCLEWTCWLAGGQAGGLRGFTRRRAGQHAVLAGCLAMGPAGQAPPQPHRAPTQPPRQAEAARLHHWLGICWYPPWAWRLGGSLRRM